MAPIKKSLYMPIAVIVVVSIIHYFITNPLEKALVYTEAPIRRPQPRCADSYSLSCMGMPSGHSEIAVIVCALLWKLNLLQPPLAATIILLMGLQRIYSKMHTVSQVITGFATGAIYAMLYMPFTNRPLIIALLAALIPAALSVLLTYSINRRLQVPTPSWLDPRLLPIVEKKMNATFFNKYMESFASISDSQMAPFYSWEVLEEKTNSLIEKIKGPVDIIVGIKSGGAIIASYMHSKMPQTKLYYLKSKTDKSENPLIWGYEEAINQKRTITLVEGIDDDISNKNVLLVDEVIDSGRTMLFAKEYLENTKKVKHVTIAAICIAPKGQAVVDKYDSVYGSTERATIWPWGYDN